MKSRAAIFVTFGACASAVAGCASTSLRGAPAAEDAFADFNGNNVYYQNYGSGDEALVLVHGWSCDSTVWRQVAPALARQHRVLAVDLIGHGRSAKPDTTYSFGYMADSVRAAMAAAGVKRAVLVGHSNGMPVIREFYRKYPVQTLALVDIDGTLRSYFNKPEDGRPMIDAFRSPKYREVAEGFIKGMKSPRMSDELMQSIVDMMMRTPQHVMAGSLEASLDPDVWKTDKINVPFQLILAKQPMWAGDYKDFVLKIAPAADYREFTDVGHFIQLERPEIVTTNIKEFLGKNRLLQ